MLVPQINQVGEEQAQLSADTVFSIRRRNRDRIQSKPEKSLVGQPDKRGNNTVPKGGGATPT